jgi:hypothetical protein
LSREFRPDREPPLDQVNGKLPVGLSGAVFGSLPGCVPLLIRLNEIRGGLRLKAHDGPVTHNKHNGHWQKKKEPHAKAHAALAPDLHPCSVDCSAHRSLPSFPVMVLPWESR